MTETESPLVPAVRRNLLLLPICFAALMLTYQPGPLGTAIVILNYVLIALHVLAYPTQDHPNP